MSNGHPASCRDCIPCEGDCDGPAFCLSEPGGRPCPHDGIWCEECRFGGCIDCRLEAEQEMYRSGEYDPRADPFYTGPPLKPLNVGEWLEELAAQTESTGYDPYTTKHRLPNKDAS